MAKAQLDRRQSAGPVMMWSSQVGHPGSQCPRDSAPVASWMHSGAVTSSDPIPICAGRHTTLRSTRRRCSQTTGVGAHGGPPRPGPRMSQLPFSYS